MRAVLDANVIVSGIARYAYAETAPARALLAAVDERYTLITSDAILAEVELALSKTYFGDRFDETYLVKRITEIRQAVFMVELTRHVQGVATHWQDDLVLSTALSGDVDFLVTGDRDLLDLKHPFPFSIIHPNAFIGTLNDGSGVDKFP